MGNKGQRLVGVTAMALLCGNALAQAYPLRPVRMIVPNLAGSATDTVARQVGQILSIEIDVMGFHQGADRPDHRRGQIFPAWD